ncbi:MAG: potassium/proton antiporter [Acidimicrobiales bacterium]
MTLDLAVNEVVLLAAVLVVVGVLSTGVADRLRVPSLLLLLGIGMLVADDGLALVSFDDAELAQSVAIVALVIILFDGGLSASPTHLREVAVPAGLLASVGVALTACVVAGASVLILDVPATTAWLIGAVVSSTDAAAVLSVLRDSPVPRRLGALLETESGLNDPVAVLLTVGVLETWAGDATALGWIGFGARQLGGGALVGVVVGLGGAWLATHARLNSAAMIAVLGSGLAGLAYGAASWLGGSGLLAVYLAGLLLGRNLSRHRHALATVHEGFAVTAQMALFLMLGLLVFPSDVIDVAGDGALIALVLALVARPLSVVAVLAWFRPRPNEVALVAWAGLRGAVPIVLATFPLTAGHPDAALVFDLVFFAVLLSVAVQGVTIGPLARRLGLASEPAPAKATLVALDTVAADVIEFELDDSALVVGQRLRDVPMPAGMRVSVLVRGNRSVVPDGDTVLAAGDLLIVVTDASAGAPGLLDRWVATAPRPLL